MSKSSTAPVARRVWRMSANAPLGEIVELDRGAEVGNRTPPSSDVDDWPETDWQTSSYDLLTGCRVKDYTGRIPDRVFKGLFHGE